MPEVLRREWIEALPWPAAVTDRGETILAGSRVLWRRLGVVGSDWVGKNIRELEDALPRTQPRFRAFAFGDQGGEYRWQVLPEEWDGDHEAVQAERMAVVGMLAGGVAHEFNNLMSGLLGYAQLAQATRAMEDYQRAVDAVEETAGRTKDIIGGLLAFAGRHWGQGSVRRVSEIARPIFSMVEAGLRNDNIEVHLDIETDGEGAVDMGRLQQVLLNTIIHSRQAMVADRGGAMRLLARVDGATLSLVLSDTHIAEESVEEAKPGMGLDISRRIMRAIGGGITVEHLPLGTVYTITCPIGLVSGQTVAAPTAEPESAEVGDGAYRILVVDDEEMVRNLVSHILRMDGHTVWMAHNGYAGVEKARHEQPDMAIIDMQMPGLSGIQTCEAIRTEHPGCRFLMITGAVGQEFDDLAEGLSALAVDVIQKPFKIETLQHSVRVAMMREIVTAGGPGEFD